MAKKRSESSNDTTLPAALVPEPATQSVLAKVNEEMDQLREGGLGLSAATEGQPEPKRQRRGEATKAAATAKANAQVKETATAKAKAKAEETAEAKAKAKAKAEEKQKENASVFARARANDKAQAKAKPKAKANGVDPDAPEEQAKRAAVAEAKAKAKSKADLHKAMMKRVKTEPADAQGVVKAADEACDAAAKDQKRKEAAEKKKLNDQKHARFTRALQPAPAQRQSGTPRCPAGLAQRILTAGKSGYAQYFAIYAGSDVNEDWAEMELKVKIQDEVREQQKQGKGWLTKADVLEKHHKDRAFVNNIVAEKERTGNWMPHPDAPTSVEHRLYHCFDFMTDQSTKDRAASKEYQFRTALGQDAARAVQGSIQDVQFASASGSSSSSSFAPLMPALCDQSAEAGQTKAPVDEDKLRQEEIVRKYEAAQALKLQKQAESKAAKALPLNQAAKWSKHLYSQVLKSQADQLEVQSTAVPTETKQEYKKRFKQAEGSMRKMADDLHNVQGDEEASTMLPAAPGPELQYKEVCKAWKKIKAANAL